MKKPASSKSAGASIAQQAAKSKAARGDVPELPTTRLENSVHPKTGLPTYWAVFPQLGGGVASRIDISFLLDFPNLLPVFGPAFLSYGRNLAPGTCRTCAGGLKLGFFHFIRNKYGTNLRPEEIDDEVLMGFRTHLNSHTGRAGKALSASTIAGYLQVISNVLFSLSKGPHVKLAWAIADRVPAGPVNHALSGTPTEVLSLQALIDIMEAAEKEVLEVEARYLAGIELVNSGNEKLTKFKSQNSTFDVTERSIDTTLARLAELYPGVLPDMADIEKDNIQIAESMKYLMAKNPGLNFGRYVQPSGRDLVGFVLLLTITTVFNPDTVLWLKWSNIDLDKESAGIPMVEIIGVKDRAKNNLVRLLDPNGGVSSDLSLERMLRLLKAFTARIRPYTADKHEDFIFLFVQSNRIKNPKSWGRLGEIFQGPSHDQVWKTSLANFIKNNQLERFTLSQIRPTVLNLVQSLDGSLEAATRVGNHGNPRTTWTHYTSDGIKKQYREQIGKILLLRERWFQSDGVIDPRIRTARSDKGASTPGFICVDPLASPRPNQHVGTLCNDYGGCPACPLAGAVPDDPDMVAFYLALSTAIFASQKNIGAKTWLTRWVPVLSALKSLLELVPEPVLAEARAIYVRLPPVG